MKKTEDGFERAQAWLARKHPAINVANDALKLVQELLIANHRLDDRILTLSGSQIRFGTQVSEQMEALEQSVTSQVAALTKKTRWQKFVNFTENLHAVWSIIMALGIVIGLPLLALNLARLSGLE